MCGQALEAVPPIPWATLAQERYEEAVHDYSQALALAPHHAKALYNRAVAHERLGRHSAALADFSAVLDLDPYNPPAYANRAALLLHKLRQPAAALTDAERALLLEQEQERLGQGRGGAGGKGAASNAGGGSAATWHLCGEALAALGRGGEALAAFERAAALDPGSTTFLRR